MQAVLFDKAGERILARSMDAARQLLPAGQEIVVYKNNSDGKGNSYASTNGDGFGLGWYGRMRNPASTARCGRPGPTRTCGIFAAISSRTYLPDVRASTGTPITRPNCHPFACGRWLFMHNGVVGNWSRMRRMTEALIPDDFYGSRVGTTDSEAVFSPSLGGGDEKPMGATDRGSDDPD